MKTVLVIEDNLEVRENTAEILTLNGYSVITAINGKEGFNEAKSKKPNLIICDIMMPETDGKTFLKLVKDDNATNSIPLVFFSAGSVPNEVRKGLVQGADEYLSKPFSEQDLLMVVERNLNGHKK